MRNTDINVNIDQFFQSCNMTDKKSCFWLDVKMAYTAPQSSDGSNFKFSLSIKN